MLHDAPSFINVRAAGDRDCYADSQKDATMRTRSMLRLLGLATRLVTVGLILICISAGSHASAADDEALVAYSCSGSRSTCREFRRVMEQRAVQTLLLEVAAAPRTRIFLDAALESTDLITDDLQKLGLISRDGDLLNLRSEQAILRGRMEQELHCIIESSSLVAHDLRRSVFDDNGQRVRHEEVSFQAV